ncbi:pyridoxal phosphate-dependent aminotransferase [Methanospirillum hungatei]|uniref:pyridoxal phosphate-dependent aminotransferase n=1 Tax=Methanospirillum hungatei TaxID=2203 RepID=UPI0026ECDDF3|nr:pyridoxal phosphate-dependent aminotransferase [Methanospirillum hungatei]MCA1916751.1 pyridoxal phosphate-dependent aminotransferase [Methanospirillum hungatei]
MKKISARAQAIEMSGIRKFFQAAKPDSINMTLGQPDFVTPDHIRHAAIQAIEEGKTGYTFNAGIPELREALSEKFKNENNLHYSPEQIIVTAGAGEALFIAIQSLVDPGDRVLLTDPGFVSYEACIQLAGGKPDFVPLTKDLHIQEDILQEKLEGARLLILNSPCNPTGTVESKETIRSITEAAMDAGVTVLSDEVYEHIIYDAVHASAGTFGEDVITVNAASKTYAMTGWRLGYIAGPPEYMEQCLKVHQYCQTCATSISQYAGIAAYTGDQSCVKMMRDEYKARRDILVSGFHGMGVEFPEPQGAFYAFVPLGKERTQKVMDAGVIVVPGDAFGPSGADYARFSYATSRENITAAIERMRPVLEV